MRIRIGTRKSHLALIQTNLVIDRIKDFFPDIECQIIPIITTGDMITDKNLYDIGGKALFLKELEEQLLDNKIDIAVHSLKDVPGILPEGLFIASVLERSDPRDCFVSFKYKSIDELPKGAIVGTSSVRRKVLLKKMRPDLELVQFRGNINTRLQKLKDGQADATILAAAGLKRAGLFDASYCSLIDVDKILPAAGQGIIALEIRDDNKDMLDICKKINHLPTWQISEAERGLLSYLDASCRTPLSAYAEFDEFGKIRGRYMMSDIDGTDVRYHEEFGDAPSASNMGINAAKILISMIN